MTSIKSSMSEKTENKEFTKSNTNSSMSYSETFEAHKLPIDIVGKYFRTDLINGLTSSSASQGLKDFGANSLGEPEKVSIGSIIAHQVFNAMILVLLISMIIALAIKDWISGGVIAFVVGINIVVGFVQEYKAEKTMGSLRSLSSPTARVTRNGDDETIPAEEVVPGDIVHIKVGDTIPADIRLIDSMNLETDEAMLTGESLPISKDYNKIIGDQPVGDRINMAYATSIVTKGRGTGIVVATALSTEIGKIAKSLKGNTSIIRKVDTSDGKSTSIQYSKAIFGTLKDLCGNVLGINVGTPLQRKLSWLAIFLFWVAVIFAIIVMASQKMIVNKEVAIYAICVALSMIPSALIVVLTITMAVGAQVMVQKHVIVRKLDSLEALGAINDICSDKTGTLTQGKMIAKKVWIPNVGTLNVDDMSNPFDPEAGLLSFVNVSPKYITETDEEIDFRSRLPSPLPQNLISWLTTAALANIATVNKSKDEETGEEVWKGHGDATEIAIQVFTKRMGYGREPMEQNLKHLGEFPFDSSIKRMSAIYENLDEDVINIYTKGAVERILGCCSYWMGHAEFDELYDNSEINELTKDDIELIESNMTALSSQGLRVLAFASKVSDADTDLTNREEVESNLIFQGLIGIYDPPRLETAGSVKSCHKAGINVHMLTGDHPGTAKAIAQEVGILPHNLYHYSDEVVKAMCMIASEFDALSDEQIDNLPVLPLVVARCAPSTKVRMIEALHRRKKFVAMTGDGVNDSPSLKKADVGIAMGLNGSDVAKDASDIVLTDDNFASILNAIEEGRRMSSNIQKFVLQLLAENVAQALFLMIGLAFFDDSGFSVFPLSPVEVLWILVITSCFPAMGLGQEKASEDILQQPPNNTIFTWEVIIDMIVYGFWMAVCCLLTFVITVFGKGDGYLGVSCNSTNGTDCNLVFRGRSASFACFTWCALILAWECIHPTNSLFYMRQDTDNNWWKQTSIDLWDNQFLFWSVLGGFVSVFPVVYIPVINNKVFLHAPIGYEWGLAIGFTIIFLAGSELWKWIKRIYSRKQDRSAKNPEYDLERNDPFEKYASFSRVNTMNV